MAQSATTSLTGKDTIKINGRILNDFADGDTAVLEYPNELVGVKTGKGGNSIYAFNTMGRQCSFTLRVLRGSSDDKFLNNLLSLFENDPAVFSLMTGELVKNIGDGEGSVTADTYILSGGAFRKKTDAKENVEGDTEQAVSVYSIIFSNGGRSIG